MGIAVSVCHIIVFCGLPTMMLELPYALVVLEVGADMVVVVMVMVAVGQVLTFVFLLNL